MTDPTVSPEGAESEGGSRVLKAAEVLGISVDIVARPPAADLEGAAALLGIAPGDIVKTLVVKHKDGTFLFALIPGGRKISWPKLRSVVGVNRLSLPDQQLAFEATGYVRGTITPLGSTTAWPVYADATITGRRVWMGAGSHGYSASVDADELLAALGAVVTDISDPE